MTPQSYQILAELNRHHDGIDISSLGLLLDRPWLTGLCIALDRLTADRWVDTWFVGRRRYAGLAKPWSVIERRLGETP